MNFSLLYKTGVLCAALVTTLSFTSCVPLSNTRSPNMGMSEVSPQVRQQEIASEPRGDFFYARRYFVEKTRFWGYLRKPGQPWSEAQLVVMNEDSIEQPDRKPESGPESNRHGYDQNYTYRIQGYYTGRDIYEPASNLFLPEFKAKSYRVETRDSGWLFTPQDHYNKEKITLVNKSIARPMQ